VRRALRLFTHARAARYLFPLIAALHSAPPARCTLRIFSLPLGIFACKRRHWYLLACRVLAQNFGAAQSSCFRVVRNQIARRHIAAWIFEKPRRA